jgi:hypothetical protein
LEREFFWLQIILALWTAKCKLRNGLLPAPEAFFTMGGDSGRDFDLSLRRKLSQLMPGAKIE